MASSFKQFSKNLFLEMPMGRGQTETDFPPNSGMANLLSIIHGPWMRARALDWLLFDGLYRAIEGRRKLCEQVNKAISGQLAGGVLRPGFGGQQAGQQHGMRAFMKAETRNPMNHWGEDPWDGNDTEPVNEMDLFSPEAWQRRPNLGKVRLNGMNILDYYEKYYEPKIMVIDYEPGQKVRVNLAQARDYLESHGLEGFRYGSKINEQGKFVNGYLQFMEKGDWLHPAMQTHGGWSNNGQHGFPMMFDDIGQDDNHNDLKPITLDKRGRPVLHLVAGPYVKDTERSAATINKMAWQFTDIGQRLENGKDLSDMDSQAVAHVKGLLSLNSMIQKAEQGIDLGNLGDRSPAKMMLGVNNVRGESFFFVPSSAGFDLDTYLATVKAGLSQPFPDRDAAQFKNLNAFGPEWEDGEPEPPDGWWKLDPNNQAKVIFKLPQFYQDKVFQHITELLSSSSVLRVRFRFADIARTKQLTPEQDPQAQRGAKLAVSVVFNQGVKSDPKTAAKFKRVYYTAPKMHAGSFIKRDPMDPVEIRNLIEPMEDETLRPLWEKGYRWELRSTKERNEGFPDFDFYGYGLLRLGQDRFRVARQESPEGYKFYLMVPTGKDEESLKPADFGLHGKSMLGTGVIHGGGRARGHLNTTPAGKQTYEKLVKILLAGGLGEGKKSQSVGDLRCVKEGIRAAKSHFGRMGRKDREFEDSELMAWGIEGLRAFSGSRAFQVGFITPDELQKILKWDDLKRQQMFFKDKYIPDPKDPKKLIDNPDWRPGDGWGIESLLAKYDLLDDEVWATIVDGVKEGMKGSPLMNWNNMPAELKAILWENSYEARKRMISLYVTAKMTAAHDAELGQGGDGFLVSLTGAGGKNAEGEAQDLDVEDGEGGGQANRIRQRDDYAGDIDDYGYADHGALRNQFGLEQPEDDESAPDDPLATFDGAPKLSNPRVVSPPAAGGPQRQLAAATDLDDYDFDPDEYPEPDFDEPAPTPAPAAGGPKKQLSMGTDLDDYDFEPDFEEPAPKPVQKPAPKPAPSPAPAQRTVPQNPAKPPVQPPRRAIVDLDDYDENTTLKGLRSYQEWLKSIRETEVVSPLKPKKGCGYNIFGAAGSKSGTSIGGKPDTAASDPTGKKGMRKYAGKQ